MTISVIEWGATAAVLTGIWIAVVLLLRGPVSRWLGARWAYGLWLLPVVALAATLVPSQPVQRALAAGGIEVPLVEALSASLFELTQAIGRSGGLDALNGPTTGAVGTPIAAADLVLIVWLAGLLAVLLPLVLRHFQSSARLLATSRKLSGEELRHLRSASGHLGERPLAALRVLDTTDGPAVAGFTDPVLLLPSDFFTRFDARQQALMLEHEFEHLRRHDLAALALARVFRGLFWFNPLVYLAEHYLRLDQESSCDERVLQSREPSVRRIYGETLLLSAPAHRPRRLRAAWSSYSHIRPRLALLRRHGQTPLRRRAGRAVVAASIAICIVSSTLADPQYGGNPEVRQALLQQAEQHYRNGDRVGALHALAESERLSPAGLPSDGLALRGRIFVDLGWWEQAYEVIDSAIERSAAEGRSPDQSWLLARTALQWKLGDLDGAARSLERSLGPPGSESWERMLALFDEVVRNTWEPAGDAAADR